MELNIFAFAGILSYKMGSAEGFIMAVVAVAAVIISRFAAKKINDKRLKQIVEMIGFLIAFGCIIISDLFDFIKY